MILNKEKISFAILINIKNIIIILIISNLSLNKFF